MDASKGDSRSDAGSLLRARVWKARRSVDRLRSGIGLRLLVRVLLFSSAVTLVVTLVELYLDYRHDVGAIESRLSEVEGSYLQSIGEGLWDLNRRQLELQVEGILRLPDIRFVEVRETTDRANPMVVAAGRRQDHAAVSREFPIFHTFRGGVQRFGVLSIQATLDEVYRTLLDRAIVILISQGAKTFLVSFFILYIAHRLVTRHLTALAGFLGSYNLRQPQQPLRLRRRAPKHKDELDQVVKAFEAMRLSLERAYDDLRRSEESYRGIYENALEGIARISPGGGVLGANPAYARTFGFARPDELVRTVSEFGRQFWPDPTEWSRLTATVLERGPVIGYEAEVYGKDRQRVWISMSARAVRDAAGAPLFFESFVSDITPRKKMEAALRESEQRFRDYAETASDWFWETGPEHQFTYFSEHASAYGVDERDPMGMRRWDIAADFASEPEKWREHMATLERREPFRDFVYKIRRVDGSVYFVSISGKPMFDAAGRFSGYRGVARDITQRKHAEESLRRSEAYLSEAQRLSRTGSWAYNRTTKEITHWAKETYRLLGFDPEAGVPSIEALLQRIHPEDRARAIAELDRPLDREADNALDYRVVLPDGAIRYIHEIGHPVFDASGNLVESVGTVIDVTERKRAEEDRRAHLWFFESMDRVNRAIQGTNDLEKMMSDVLGEMLSIFNCDRAWLVYPCDPGAASWRAQMEHTRPDFPGAFALGVDLPVDAEVASVFRTARASSGAVRFGPGSERPVPAQLAERFSIQSIIGMAVYPKIDRPYLLGLHQCSYPRDWTAQEERLFQEIGRRLADALTTLLVLRNLRESEARLEEAQRVAHVGYWDRNLETDRVTWSDEAYRIFGLAPQARTMTFAALQELIHSEDRAIMVRAVGEALRGGPRYDVEYRVVRPSGEIRVVHSQGDVTRDESGRSRRMFGTVQDVTERRRAEEDLRRSEAYLAEAQRLTRTGGWAYSHVTREIAYWAEETYRLLGFNPKAGLPSTEAFLQHVHPEDRTRTKEQLATALHGRTDSELDYRIVLPDGAVRYIHDIGHPVFDASGNLAESVGTVIDVTERRLAEDSLRASEERWRRMFESSSVGIGLNDSSGRFMAINPALQRMLGYTEEELRGRPPGYVTHEADRAATEAMVAELIEGRRPGYAMQKRYRRKDGSVIWADVSAFNVPATESTPAFFAAMVVDITERRRAEEELQRQTTHLDQLFELAPVAVALIDASYRILRVNREFTRVFGYTLEDARDHNIDELIVPEELQAAAKEYGRLTTAGQRIDAEVARRRKDGSRLHVSLVAAPISIAAGKMGSYCIYRDITQRRRVEESLRVSEQRWRKMFESAPVGMALVELDGRIMAANPALQRMLGYTEKEMRALSAGDAAHEDDREGIEAMIAELAKGRRHTVSIETRYRRKNESVIWTDVSAFIVPATERISPFVTTIVVDITERRRAEAALRASEERWRAIFENSDVGIALSHPAGPFVSANSAFQQMLGYTEAELQALSFLDITHEDDRQLNRALMSELVAGKRKRLELEKRYRRRDGRLIWVRVNASLVLRTDHTAGFSMAIVEDITERKRAEEALRKVQAELAHVNRVTTMGQLAASIAHEVNQPIAAAVTNAHAALRWLDAQPPNLGETRQALGRIVQDGNRAGDVIGRIRALVKKVPRRHDPVDINEIILEVIALTRSELLRNGVSLQTQLAQDLPLVQGDRIQLQQVVLNFIVNAIEAMSEVSEGSRELLIGTEEDGSDRVLVAVRDSGPGLPAESLEHLFDAFYTTKPGGMGMGLSICRSIIEIHGGRVWAGPNAPKGAVFQFTLPAAGEEG